MHTIFTNCVSAATTLIYSGDFARQTWLVYTLPLLSLILDPVGLFLDAGHANMLWLYNTYISINASTPLSVLLKKYHATLISLSTIGLGTLIALICGGYCFRYLDGQARLIYKVVLFSMIIDSVGIFLASKNIHNYWWYNMYIPINGPMLLAAISKMRLRSSIHKIVPYASASIIVFWLLNIGYTDIYHLANWAFVYSCIVVSVFYFAAMFVVAKEYDGSLLRHPFFWLSLGVILYFGTNVPLFSLRDFIIQHNRGIASALFVINNYLCITYYLLITISFIIHRRNGVKAAGNTL